MFADLPPFATFNHAGVRDGFESVCFRAPHAPGEGFLLEGGTAAIEDGIPWSVHYRVAVDENWHTTRVEATGISPSGHHQLTAEVRDGRWWINGTERPDLDGCVDIDFETSLVTNTLAVHRIDLASTTPINVPAAFVRADDLRVERMEQTYLCIERNEAAPSSTTPAPPSTSLASSSSTPPASSPTTPASAAATSWTGLRHRHDPGGPTFSRMIVTEPRDFADVYVLAQRFGKHASLSRHGRSTRISTPPCSRR